MEYHQSQGIKNKNNLNDYYQQYHKIFIFSYFFFRNVITLPLKKNYLNLKVYLLIYISINIEYINLYLASLLCKIHSIFLSIDHLFILGYFEIIFHYLYHQILIKYFYSQKILYLLFLLTLIFFVFIYCLFIQFFPLIVYLSLEELKESFLIYVIQ